MPGARRARGVGFSAEQLEIELKWIDEHVGDKPYGVDIVIPASTREGDGRPRRTRSQAARDGPAEHRAFAKRLLSEHGVPELPEGTQTRELLGWTAATAGPQIEVMLKHPKVKLVANALGTPPAEIIKEIQQSAAWSARSAAASSTPCAQAAASIS